MKTLIKFKIKSFEALANLEDKAVLCMYKPMMRQILEAYPQDSTDTQELFKQFKAILVMHEVEKQAQVVLEATIGKQLTMIFSLSIMVLPSSKRTEK